MLVKSNKENKEQVFIEFNDFKVQRVIK